MRNRDVKKDQAPIEDYLALGDKLYLEGDTLILDGVKKSNFDLMDTFFCGQCFRWTYDDKSNTFTGIAFEKVLKLEQKEDHLVFHCSKEDFNNIWKNYFDLEVDYEAIKEELKKDNILKKAIEFAPGIRLLKQELFETAISFIISSNSNIKRIRKNILDLSTNLGQHIIDEHYAFPTALAIAQADSSIIDLCKIGYRADYIKKASQAIVEKDTFHLGHYSSLPYEEAKNELMQLRGVGPKVADCIILFSGISMNAFPTDVWVKRVMENLYIKKEVTQSYVQKYGQERFGKLAGYAQQYLFYYALKKNIGV